MRALLGMATGMVPVAGAQVADSLGPIPLRMGQRIRVRYDGALGVREAYRVMRAGPDSLIFEPLDDVPPRIAVPWSGVRRLDVGMEAPADQRAAARRGAWKGALGGFALGAGVGAFSKRAAVGAAAGAVVGGWFGYIFGGQGAERRKEVRWHTVYMR